MSEGLTRRDLLRGRFWRGLRDTLATAVVPPPGDKAPTSPPRPSRRPRVMPILRPPGALSEAQFLDACTRCKDCITACPHGAITLAPQRLRGAAGTPMIDPAKQPCLLCPDMPCISACDPGALKAGERPSMGQASIDPFSCLAHQGSFCSTCAERCPVPGAVTITEGKPTIHEASCVGCGICQYVCPAPNNAIRLMPSLIRP